MGLLHNKPSHRVLQRRSFCHVEKLQQSQPSLFSWSMSPPTSANSLQWKWEEWESVGVCVCVCVRGRERESETVRVAEQQSSSLARLDAAELDLPLLIRANRSTSSSPRKCTAHTSMLAHTYTHARTSQGHLQVNTNTLRLRLEEALRFKMTLDFKSKLSRLYKQINLAEELATNCSYAQYTTCSMWLRI